MTLIEAAKQARNMLEHIDLQDADRDFLTTGECEELDRIIELINKAIAEAEQQKPVAWMWEFEHDEGAAFSTKEPTISILDGVNYVPLYTVPPKWQAEGAAWQWLTDDEIESCNKTTTDWGEPCVWLWDDDFEEGGLQFARAIEAKLKEKNT